MAHSGPPLVLTCRIGSTGNERRGARSADLARWSVLDQHFGDGSSMTMSCFWECPPIGAYRIILAPRRGDVVYHDLCTVGSPTAVGTARRFDVVVASGRE
jgi:hypothetical protein